MHRKFDLKGSTVDRQASTKEKVDWNYIVKYMYIVLYNIVQVMYVL